MKLPAFHLLNVPPLFLLRKSHCQRSKMRERDVEGEAESADKRDDERHDLAVDTSL
jgi:hypothetical protein